MSFRQPDLPVLLQILMGTVVDQFMANRPLNVMLSKLVDRSGKLVYGPVDVWKRCQMFIERDPHDNVAGVHMRLHRNDILGAGTVVSEFISGQHWDAACSAKFETMAGILIEARQDKQSGWITLHFKELDDLLKRVGELRVA